MSEKIYAKSINGRVYYYLQSSYRIKEDSRNKGKTKGSGKSKVVTNSTYLGTAESIKKRLSTIKEPITVKIRQFGFVTALLSTANEIGLTALLQEHIKGKRYGIERWKFFLLAIINRLHQPTSKEKMGQWALGTVLPDLLNFDAKELNSKSFWYVTDDVISEKKLAVERAKNETLEEDIFTNINDAVFKKIERTLVRDLLQQLNISPEVTLYDTSNFFTYFSQTNASMFAQTGHCKAGKHSNRLIGLALCVDRQWGLPLFHEIYKGNAHDSTTFYQVTTELITLINDTLKLSNDVTLIIDKGNNSKNNFTKLKDKIDWIGSLSIFDYKDLATTPIDEYNGLFHLTKYYTLEKQVYNIPLKLVVTYSDKLYRKQEHSMNNSIEKFKSQVLQKWNKYKKPPSRISKGIKSMLKKSRHKDYLKIRCRKGQIYFEIDHNILKEKQITWGKHIIFSSNLNKTPSEIIELYYSKDMVEKGFEILKSPDLIRWIPMRHWTDTKIRAFAFNCVMALMLIRVMEFKLEQENMKMSSNVIKIELSDLQEVKMIYDEKRAINKI